MAQDNDQARRITSQLTVPPRSGPRPAVSPAPMGTKWAQSQFSQQAPPEMQENLVGRVLGLRDVTIAPSGISVPGARGFFLDYARFTAPMFAVNEFAHIHPDFDGSLHVMASPELCRRIATSGWGELHARTDQVAMVYGPRDDDEVGTVFSIVEIAYRYAASGGLKDVLHRARGRCLARKAGFGGDVGEPRAPRACFALVARTGRRTSGDPEKRQRDDDGTISGHTPSGKGCGC